MMNSMLSRKFLAASALALMSASVGSAQEMKDHPLISRFAGSMLKNNDSFTKEFDEFPLVTGPFKGGKFLQMQRLEGKITHLHYMNPPNRSTLEVFRSYQNSLAQGRFQTLFACSDLECGDPVNSPLQQRWIGYWCVGIAIQCPEPVRYVAAKLTRPAGDVYISLKVSANDFDGTFLNLIELKSMSTGLVTVNAAALANDITTTGHAAVYGIYFDTGKAILKPESGATLAEIGKLLAARTELKLHVVGHTDNVGTAAANMTLSKQRADAVVAALVMNYQVDGKRLQSAGVGSLSPVATDRTEDGRAKNRRVELVEQ
jgi:OOP family OmpA-OmpF porin